MKKFLIIAIAAGAVALAALYAVLYEGFYIDTGADENVEAVFTSREDAILKDGEKFTVKGVEVSASMPEHPESDYEPETEDYLRWFRSISDMGANTVKAAGIMDEDFYKALREFNERNDAPLYLLQGCVLEDAVNYGEGDAREQDYMGRLIEDGRRMVDVIHGNRIIMAGSHGRGNGWYREDVSQWVLGFLVGSQWDGDTVLYTNHETVHSGKYSGKYFVTGEAARPFEAMLAEVMDEMVAYESEKYGQQHLIGFANGPQTDPLEYRDDSNQLREAYEMTGQKQVTYARQLNKISSIDAENIQATSEVKAGYFAGYNIYDFCDDFSRFLSERQPDGISEIIEGIDKEAAYGGYLEFLAEYHSMPVLCCSYGFSTSRGVVSDRGFPITERQQGERLVDIYGSMIKAGWSGAVINSWQDRWELKSWNTSYAQDFTNNSMWHDVQTEAQGYGLMEFTGEKRVIDGDAGEWTEDDIVCRTGELALSAYADGEGLALLVEGKGVSREREICIPVDVTDKSGSKEAKSAGLTFSHPADFLLCLSGTEKSRLLVQARYESVRSTFLREMTGEDAYISAPDADSEEFIPVNMAVENRTIVEYINYSNREQTYLPAFETGKLRHGSGDSSKENFDSLADFCYGDNCVEIKIPWALLNFANPEDMLIHDDYYENYGVEFMKAGELRLGVSEKGGGKVKMKDFALEWPEQTYKERLKQSYYIVREAWR